MRPAAAAGLAKSPTIDTAVDASNALQALAAHFDGQPNATLSPASLANTASALEARRRAETTFAALPGAFRGLAAVFSGRSDDIFVPVGIGGDESASLGTAVDAFVSQDRTATRLYVATADDPYSITAFGTVRAARVALANAAPSFGQGATAYLGGSTAQLADVEDVLSSDFLRVGAITVLGILIVLVLLLRARRRAALPRRDRPPLLRERAGPVRVPLPGGPGPARDQLLPAAHGLRPARRARAPTTTSSS